MADLNNIPTDYANWLLDAVAMATQDRRFLREDPAYDEVAGEAILANGEKAIRLAFAAATDAQAQEIAKLRAALKLAELDQVDFLNVCTKYAKEADDPGKAHIRTIRAGLVADRLLLTQAALKAVP